jgi:hypothetical protein
MSHQEEQSWERLCKALFGVRETTDSSLFTFGVMERVRALEPALQEMAWHRFLRWTVPMLGAGVASLILAARAPAPSVHTLLNQALSATPAQTDDPLRAAMEVSQ